VSTDLVAFFGVITEPLLVRDGQEVTLQGEKHNRVNVYSEMLLHVVRDYAGIGDWRSLEEHEIEFFYDALRYELKKATKPRPPGKR